MLLEVVADKYNDNIYFRTEMCLILLNFRLLKPIIMKRIIKNFRLTLALAFMLLVLTGCAHSIALDNCVDAVSYGFFGGLWHGFIAPFSFVVSLFMDDVALYAVNNNGGWYDFGFVLGAGILFGGGGKVS